jgi:hypothetical protein
LKKRLTTTIIKGLKNLSDGKKNQLGLYIEEGFPFSTFWILGPTF